MSSAVGFGDAHIGAFFGHEFVSQEVVLQPPDEDGGHVIDVARAPSDIVILQDRDDFVISFSVSDHL